MPIAGDDSVVSSIVDVVSLCDGSFYIAQWFACGGLLLYCGN